jgi:hypothetical protein
MDRETPGSTACMERVDFHPTTDPKVVAIEMLNDDGTTFCTLVGPDGVRALLLRCLGVATRWADEPLLEPASWSGPTQALQPTHVEIATGRTAAECALRVFLGSVELTFLLSIDDVLNAVTPLVRRLEGGSSSPLQ